MDKLEPIKCCCSGCEEWANEEVGWWGDFVYCTRHHEELLKTYEEYLRTHPEDLEDIF